MAIVITNGTYYVKYTETGAVKKTTDINCAYQFTSVSEAIKGMRRAEKKTKNYYVLNTLTNHVVWKKLTDAERIEMIENKSTLTIERDNKGKIKRRTYSPDVRKLIYNYANGRCELCGRKILFDDMTIDHIKPLSMGGADVVENLACTCYTCNTFKGNVNPDNFMERISLIYLYQLEKKCKNKVKWAVMRKILNHVN